MTRGDTGDSGDSLTVADDVLRFSSLVPLYGRRLSEVRLDSLDTESKMASDIDI